jgi:eukaryotic-like serine/threonine-protein kinase
MALAAGEYLGRYEILALIGAGGMGEVYSAADRPLDRVVALKVSKEEFCERLTREGRAIAALNHPHICAVHDIGPNYLVMEYVDGAPIQGPLPVADALRLGSQIADALAFAHSKGITHRDLKPANIMVTASGVKLLDFGLAKLTIPGDSEVTRTIAGNVMGTASYMSPEQAQGQPADERSDIFSFGVVLYEMLSGRRAFLGNTAIAVLAAVVRDQPVPLDAPPEVTRVVDRCLRKSPAERFQTAAELHAALEAAAASKPEEEASSIAVLPFTNLSGDQENEYLSDGLAEEIVHGLSHVPRLKITEPTSAFFFKGKHVKIADIARELGVQHVLEGSVSKADNRIRVTAQLLQAADGIHLWSQRYDREMTDVFAIEDEISAAIADQLEVHLTGRQHATTNLAAYEAFLEGRHYWRLVTPANFAKALEHFLRAAELDPGYAPAHLGIADYYFGLAAMGLAPARQALADSRAAALRAIQLDQNLGEAHAALGRVAALCYEWTDAEHHYRRALEVKRSPDTLINHAFRYLLPRGRFDEALSEFDQALLQGPLSLDIRYGRAMTLVYLRRYEQAVEYLKQTCDIDPGFWLAHYGLAMALLLDQRPEKAAGIIDKDLQVHGGLAYPLRMLGWINARAGRTEEAQRILVELRNLNVPSYTGIALTYLGLGDQDAGFQWAERAIEERETFISMLKVDPLFDSLRSHPHYRALLHKMNLA